jgi:hypothetical protein
VPCPAGDLFVLHMSNTFSRRLRALIASDLGILLTADDRYLINLPLFHVGGTLFVTERLGVAVPVIETLARLVRAMESIRP